MPKTVMGQNRHGVRPPFAPGRLYSIQDWSFYLVHTSDLFKEPWKIKKDFNQLIKT